MMIQRFAVMTLAAALGTSAQATEFNKDALKTMQQQGHEIAEDAPRRFKAKGDFCLDTSDDGLVVKACSDEATQKWKFDDKRRLVANSGRCVAVGKLADCDASDVKSWTHDDAKRLVNADGKCLQIKGNTPKADAKVVNAACKKDVVGQVWEQAAHP
ncbi:MAG: RICIN domain-containing protein [Xanthomonadales bacterium]|nr:RICIN domain-containing protein [Xanthomonadales bacterium]